MPKLPKWIESILNAKPAEPVPVQVQDGGQPSVETPPPPAMEEEGPALEELDEVDQDPSFEGTEEELEDLEDDIEAEALDGEAEVPAPEEVDETRGPGVYDPTGGGGGAMAPEAPPQEEKPKEVRVETVEAVINAKAFKDFLRQVAVVADEAKLVADAEGFHVLSVDPAHVAMVTVDLPSFTCLEGYQRHYGIQRMGESPISTPVLLETGIPEKVEIGVDVDKLMEVAKRAKEVVRFAYDGAKNRLELSFNGERRTMALVDTAGMAEPKIPKLDLPAVLDLPADALIDALRGCGSVSDHVAFTVDDGGGNGPRFVVKAEGEVDTFEMVFGYDDWIEKVQYDGATYRTLFPLDYMSNFMKTMKGNRLRIHLGTDYPVRIDWTGPTTRGTWLCAPRIEAE